MSDLSKTCMRNTSAALISSSLFFVKTGIISFLALLLLLLSVRLALAAVRCETQYGGGQVCVTTGELQINKKVLDPQSGTFIDNLGLNSRRFGPGDEITFRLEIKNVGDATFSKVTVTDSLPPHLELVLGNLTFDITDLTPGETETRDIRVRVVGVDKFPGDKSLICEVNAVEVRGGNQQDRDTAQVCLEKKVAAEVMPKRLPKAGIEDWVIPGFLSLAIGGLLINRRFQVAKKE